MTITVRNVKISKGLQITIPAEIRRKYGLKKEMSWSSSTWELK